MTHLATLLMLAMMWCSSAYSQPPQLEVMGICKLFELMQSHDNNKYANKQVELRGEFRRGPHGIFITESGCATPLKTRGLAWPTAVCLVSSEQPEVVPPVAFQSDWKSILNISTVFEKAMQADAKSVLMVEIAGELRIKSTYENPTIQDKTPYGVGFCHSGAFPAMLVVKKVKSYKLLQPNKRNR